MSQTPYTKAHAVPASTGFGVDDYCDDYVHEDKVAALELAANGLRYSMGIVSWRCSNLHHAKLDQHHIGDPCPVEARIESILAEFDALKDTALQPKEPHE